MVNKRLSDGYALFSRRDGVVALRDEKGIDRGKGRIEAFKVDDGLPWERRETVKVAWAEID